MTAPAEPSRLPDRWIAAAAEDPATHAAILRLIDDCRSGASINETALLNALVQHANEIAAQDAGTADAVASQGAGDGEVIG